MRNRYQQSMPPSVHDVYRGLPIGPGGIEPFLFKDRDPVPSPNAVYPRSALISMIRRGLAVLISKGDGSKGDRYRQPHAPTQPAHIGARCCP